MARQWSDASVIVPFVLAVVFFILFILVELYVAKEPVLAPFLLKKKVPVLTGVSNFLVANCNFSIMYFFPMWFETVALTNASIAGKCAFEIEWSTSDITYLIRCPPLA